MKSRRILLVDDSDFMRKHISNLFLDKKYKIETVENGEDALQEIRSFHPDVILIDYNMPEMDGIELCRRIRDTEVGMQAQLIMLTAKEDEDLKKAAFEAGVSNFFLKDSFENIIFDYIESYFQILDVKIPAATIVVIEDSNFMAKRMKSLLANSGFQFIIFQHPEKFINYFVNKGPCDILLLDLNMPDLSGFDVIKKVRREMHTESLPIIVMSGSSKHTDIVKAFYLGANDFVSKPLQRDELLARLKAHFNVSKLQRELEEQNKNLEILTSRQREFLGIAAHDLRNPLTAVKEGVKFLLNSDLTNVTTTKDVLNVILRSSKKMIDLINDLLNINQIETGNIKYVKEKVTIANFIEDVKEENKLLAEKKDIKLIFDNQVGDKEVFLDVQKINQVMNNFVSNAIKYSFNKTFVLVKLFDKESSLVVEVTDQGQGIPKDEVHLVFKEFSKLSVRPTAGEASTGLGLAICKKIIEGHGGKVGFSSKEGQGSTFFFELDNAVV